MHEVALKPSRYLRCIVWCAHALAAALIFSVALPLWLQMPALVLVGLSLWRFHAHRVVTALAMNDDGTLSLCNASGNWTTYDVLGRSRVYAGIVVLALRESESGETCNEVLLADAIGAEDFRRLRVWLLWNNGTEEQS